MDVDAVTPVAPVRGCGRRVPGGVYAEVHLHKLGRPIEDFLVDPPLPVDAQALGLTARGVTVLPNPRDPEGPADVLDIVGRKNYPHVADFVEEARRKGVSRRLPANLDFSRLGKGSRLILLHEEAVVDNFGQFLQPPDLLCPKGLPQHDDAPLHEQCAGVWWTDFSSNEVVWGRRQFTDFSYRAQERPVGVTPKHRLGIFLVLWLDNLAVVRGKLQQEQERAAQNLERARKAGLKVKLVEE